MFSHREAIVMHDLVLWFSHDLATQLFVIGTIFALFAWMSFRYTRRIVDDAKHSALGYAGAIFIRVFGFLIAAVALHRWVE